VGGGGGGVGGWVWGGVCGWLWKRMRSLGMKGTPKGFCSELKRSAHLVEPASQGPVLHAGTQRHPNRRGKNAKFLPAVTAMSVRGS